VAALDATIRTRRLTYPTSGSYCPVARPRTPTPRRIMYDQAFYNDAAERIPPSVFAPLRDTPTPSDHNAMDVPAVVIRFTPGDSTLYEILIARGRNAEAIVVVANMRLVFGVPWHDGAYVHPSYLAGQATHGWHAPAMRQAPAPHHRRTRPRGVTATPRRLRPLHGPNRRCTSMTTKFRTTESEVC
jgi:hypothetical protein